MRQIFGFEGGGKWFGFEQSQVGGIFNLGQSCGFNEGLGLAARSSRTRREEKEVLIWVELQSGTRCANGELSIREEVLLEHKQGKREDVCCCYEGKESCPL